LLRARIATAVLLLGAFLFALFGLGREPFAVLVAVVVFVAGHEWAGLTRLRGIARWGYASALATLYGALAWAWIAGQPASWLYGIACVFWVAVVPAWIGLGVRERANVALRWTGPVVIVPAAVAMVELHPGPLLAALALPWVADTAAYFAGRAWGRRKLAPSVSPGKTLEGALAGLAAVVAYAMICPAWLPRLSPVSSGAGLAALAGAALLLGVLSIYGDLFESAVKRQAGAKDSGTLLPGHGGVLDRIDSATSTLPLAALMFQLLPTRTHDRWPSRPDP